MSDSYDERRVEYEQAVEDALQSAWNLLCALDSEDAGWEYGGRVVLRARLLKVQRLRRAKAVAA